MAVQAQFPAPLQALFVPKRYKVLYGGRGGAKSWGVARALLLLGAQRKLTVLCARELQKSIDDSVHKLLREQIIELGLESQYDVQKVKIYHKFNGTSFGFEGIKNNISGIRSYEGVDICWLEEAVNTSEYSWNVLYPTIRKEGSEIWLTFNPELEEDFIYKKFVLDKSLEPRDAKHRFAAPILTDASVRESDQIISIKMSYRDNPWFPSTLKREMELDKEKDFDKYLHVWEGHCKINLEGTIYAKELRAATLESRITVVPYERSVPVDTFWDLGRADNTAIWFVQRVGMQWRIIDYYEESMEDIAHYLGVCQRREYLYGTFFLPHDAKHQRLGMRNSIEQQVRDKRLAQVKIVPRMNPSDGRNMVRQVFPQCWFDEEKTSQGLRALRNYRYKVDTSGRLSNEPLHDWASDGADAFRYFAVSVNVPRDSTEERAGRVMSKLGGALRSLTEGSAALGQHWLGM